MPVYDRETLVGSYDTHQVDLAYGFKRFVYTSGVVDGLGVRLFAHTTLWRVRNYGPSTNIVFKWFHSERNISIRTQYYRTQLRAVLLFYYALRATTTFLLRTMAYMNNKLYAKNISNKYQIGFSYTVVTGYFLHDIRF